MWRNNKNKNNKNGVKVQCNGACHVRWVESQDVHSIYGDRPRVRSFTDSTDTFRSNGSGPPRRTIPGGLIIVNAFTIRYSQVNQVRTGPHASNLHIR